VVRHDDVIHTGGDRGDVIDWSQGIPAQHPGINLAKQDWLVNFIESLLQF
jgi:hypothetical protein